MDPHEVIAMGRRKSKLIDLYIILLRRKVTGT